MPASTPIQEALALLRGKDAEYVIVSHGRRIAGTVPVAGMIVALDNALMPGVLGDIIDPRFILARPTDSMFHLFNRFSRGFAKRALVVDVVGVPHVENVVGVISRHHIADAVLENFSAYLSESRAGGRALSMLRRVGRRRP